MFCYYYWHNISKKCLYSDAENNFLKWFSQYFVIALIFFCTIILFIGLNIESCFSFLAKYIGSHCIDKYFPPSKNGIRALYPVLLFGFTIVVIVVIDTYSSSRYESLYLEKIEDVKRQTGELYKKGFFKKAFEKGDEAIHYSSKPIIFKGVLAKIVNNSAISYYVDFFRIEK